MRNIFLFLTAVFLFSSCESNSIEESTNETPTESLIDQRFQTCYYQGDFAKNKCDSVLLDFFGSTNFSFLQLNEELSFIGSDESDSLSMLQFGDENCCVPRTYDLVYDIKMNKEVIYQIPMVAGSNMEFDFISPSTKEQMEGYKLLLGGKFKFDYKDLTSLMKSEQMNPTDFMIELVRDTLLPKTDLSSYSWEIEDDRERPEFMTSYLNAMTGDFTRGRPTVRMGD